MIVLPSNLPNAHLLGNPHAIVRIHAAGRWQTAHTRLPLLWRQRPISDNVSGVSGKVYESFDDAVADIPDGASIMLSGFGGPGTARNLIAALLRQGAKELTLIANTPGRWQDERIDGGVLVRNGRVAVVRAAFTASPHPSIVTPFAELYDAGKIEAELMPQGTLAERIRAGGAGIAAFYTPTGVGTEMAEGKETRTFNGREYVLETALRADYALIRAHRADSLGNVQYHRTQRNFGPVMARAAKVTIVEVDEPVVEPGEIDPDHVHTPGVFVNRIVVVPPDALQEEATR